MGIYVDVATETEEASTEDNNNELLEPNGLNPSLYL